MNKKIIILGTEGFVGSHLYTSLFQYFDDENIIKIDKNFFPESRVLDFNDFELLVNKIKVYFDEFKGYDFYIINLLSASNVDWCENNKKQSKFINFDFPKFLIEALATFNNVTFINFSSNAVYDGLNGSYKEQSPRNPVNIYGEHKCLLDDFILNSDLNYFLIRPTTLFGDVYPGSRSNPVADICRAAIQEKKMLLVDDLVVNFGHVDVMCKSINQWILKDYKNVHVNFGGPENLSRYDLGTKIYMHFNKDLNLISPCKVSDFDNAIPRPLNTTFDCSHFSYLSNINNISVTEYLSTHEDIKN